MLSSVAEWTATVLAIGVVAGLVLLAAGVAGLLWLRRALRRRVRAYGPRVARFVREVAVGGGWDQMLSQPDRRWAALNRTGPG